MKFYSLHYPRVHLKETSAEEDYELGTCHEGGPEVWGSEFLPVVLFLCGKVLQWKIFAIENPFVMAHCS
jgi:hypothetical protein